MTEQKIAACIICGDEYDEEEVKDLLKSLEGHVHGVFVNYNGKKDLPDWGRFTTLPVKMKTFEWKKDFALARNQSFSMVPKDEYDWMLWIDTDDIFVVNDGTSVQEMLESIDPYTDAIFLRYAYAVEPETKIVVVEQWRERFLSTKIDWTWQFPIHEVCRTYSNAQFAKRDHCYIEHKRTSGDDRGARDRNREIILKALSENQDEPRFWFYYAGETMAEADAEENLRVKATLIDEAINAFNHYRSMVNDLSDDVYLATSRIAELHRFKRDFAAALEADMECVAIYPDWPDGYVGAAKSCMELGQYSRMKAFADMATKCNKPQTAASIEPMMAGFTPLLLRGIANEELGLYEQAINDYEEALKLWHPPSDDLPEKIKLLKSEIGKDKEEDVDLRKKYRGTKPEKSICFFTQPIPEDWHPEILKTSGSGGAEICIMKLAPIFAENGWRTVVFGTPGQHRGVYEGVEYWDSQEFLTKEKFTAIISSRTLLPFAAGAEAKANFLWMHDVNIGPQDPRVMSMVDKVIGLTDWHSKHLQKLYGLSPDKLSVVHNGIDLSRFPIEERRDVNPYRFIYSSSPDRGLEQLLGMWPMIKNRYSEAELHIFYGWDMINKILDFYSSSQGIEGHPLKLLKDKVFHHIQHLGGEEAGIFQRGRVTQDELAKEMLKSNIWAYPTGFCETFCITALEQQAAGVTPIVSNLAALQETVSPVYERIEGWPGNSDYQRRFLTHLGDTLDNIESEEIKNKKEEAREFVKNFSWESSYQSWENLIEQYI